MTIAPKQEVPKMSTFTPPPATLKGPSTNQTFPVATNPVSRSHSQVSSNAAAPQVDECDEELDQLLGLEKPVLSGLEKQSPADGENAVPEKGEYLLLVVCFNRALILRVG